MKINHGKKLSIVVTPILREEEMWESLKKQTEIKNLYPFYLN